MSTPHHDRRRRHLATAAVVVAAFLAVAGCTVLGVALLGQRHPTTSSAGAARPAAERDLAPTSSVTPPATPTASASGRAPSASRPVTVGPVLDRSLPVAITASRIKVQSARLAAYGLDAQGAIAIPAATPTTPAGWYTGSPTPGQLGPSVIVGHVDTARSGPSVFYHLAELRPGDRVEVTRADHRVAVFAVDSVETYVKAQFPTLQVYGNIDHAGLRLITCGGPFNAAKGHYEDNIVAYAHLVSSNPA